MVRSKIIHAVYNFVKFSILEWMDTDMDHGKKLKQRDIVPFEDLGLAQMLEDIPVNSNADEDFLDSFMDLTDFLLPVSYLKSSGK